MKVITAEVIKNGEQELIDAINGDLDWEVVERAFRQQHGLDIDEDIVYKRGDLVVHDNQVAYRLEFEVKVIMAVLMDREGNYLSAGTSPIDGDSERSVTENRVIGDRSIASAQGLADPADETPVEKDNCGDDGLSSAPSPHDPPTLMLGDNGGENEAVIAALAPSLDPPPAESPPIGPAPNDPNPIDPNPIDPATQNNTVSDSPTDLMTYAQRTNSAPGDGIVVDNRLYAAETDPMRVSEADPNDLQATEIQPDGLAPEAADPEGAQPENSE